MTDFSTIFVWQQLADGSFHPFTWASFVVLELADNCPMSVGSWQRVEQCSTFHRFPTNSKQEGCFLIDDWLELANQCSWGDAPLTEKYRVSAEQHDVAYW